MLGRYLRWLPWPPSPGVTPQCNAVPLRTFGICRLLPTNGIWQKWWNVTHMITFHYLILHHNKLERDSPLVPEEANSHVYERATAEGTVIGSRIWGRPPLRRQGSLSYSHEERNSASNQMSLEAGPPPVNLQGEIAAPQHGDCCLVRPATEEPPKLSLNPWPTETER